MNTRLNTSRNLRVLALTLTLGASVLVAGCNPKESTAPNLAPATSVGVEIDDTAVTTKVKSALLADSTVKSFDIKAETRKGVVQLSGFVDNQAQVDRAIEVTRSVSGVSGVVNKLSVKK